MPAKLIDAGIDYLRVTSRDSGAKARMIDLFRRVAGEDQKLGYEVKAGGALGFFGSKTRHVLYGDKQEWSMLQISGRAAKSALRVAHQGTQATRLDLQLTVRVGEENVEKTIREAYQAACAVDRPEARHMKISMIEQRGKAQTVYLGARASDIFFRIYDKFAESGKEEYRGCVRYELELKGRASKALWQELVLYKTTLLECLEMVKSMLLARGVVVPVQEIEAHDIQLPPRQATKEESTVAWLARSVAPTVSRLTSSHGWVYPFSALFSSAVEEVDRKRILKALSLNWGS